MCGELYVWRVPSTKTTPHGTPLRLCSIYIHFAVHKRGYSPALLYIYTQYAGTNPVLYDTLYILLYNYSLNYTLTNT